MKTKPIRTAPTDSKNRVRKIQSAPVSCKPPFSAFQELGYGGASTLEIATRAKVPKRELYTYFSNKQALVLFPETETPSIQDLRLTPD